MKRNWDDIEEAEREADRKFAQRVISTRRERELRRTAKRTLHTLASGR